MRVGPVCVLALLAAILPAGVAAEELVATVVDPQGLVVLGAHVRLVCPTFDTTTQTDARGRLQLDLPVPAASCVINIDHPGFARFERRVGHAPQPWIIELALGRIEETSEVAARSAERAWWADEPLASAGIAEGDLRAIGLDPDALLDFAKAMAGTTLRGDRVYVDGLPARVPPARMMGYVAINADPFSAEYAEADENRIEIATVTPDRRPRMSAGGMLPAAGGRNVLAPDSESVSRSATLDASGPVPFSPVVFAAHGSTISSRHDVPVVAVTGDHGGDGEPSGPWGTPISSRSATLVLSGHYAWRDTLRGALSFSRSSFRSERADVGGLVLPEAGGTLDSDSLELRASLVRTGTRVVYRGGAVLSDTSTTTRAAGLDPALVVSGAFQGGGAPVADSQGTHASWTIKQVVHSTPEGRDWKAGVTLSRGRESQREQPNPGGTFQFESLRAYAGARRGLATGAWLLEERLAPARTASTTAAAFVEGALIRSPRFRLSGGVRADYQSGAGVRISPRLFAATRARGFRLRGGGGLFVQRWSEAMLLPALQRDGSHGRAWLATEAGLPGTPGDRRGNARPLLSALDDRLERPEYILARVSIDHPHPRFTPGVEYTWTGGRHLLGSRRTPTPAGWIDRLRSDRRASKHQLHARVDLAWKGQRLVAHYEWIRSHDDTDGPWSFPERWDDGGAEWARTTGLSPHNVSLVAMLNLGGGTRLSLVAAARAPAPEDVSSGRDVQRNGLFNDRAGRRRNSGTGPAYRSLSLFAYRKVKLPDFVGFRRTRLFAEIGAQIDNLFGWRNYLGYGQVIGSPLYGRPWGGLPGRSLRVWVTVGSG